MRTPRGLAAIGVVAVLAVLVAGCSGTPEVGPTGPRVTPSPAPSGAGPEPSAGAGPSGPATVDVVDGSDVATGLRAPWGLAALADGRVLVTSRDDARLVVVRPDGRVLDVTGPGAAQLAEQVVHRGEGGLLGVAVLGDDGAHDGPLDVVLYATTAQDNRVLRGTLDGTTLSALHPVLTGIPAADHHDGGRLAVGPDGYLYVTTGDAGRTSRSQDVDDLGGKILRITADGRPADGNPFPGSPVWSLGHRNVQGIGWAPDGRMFAAEFGQSTWDEVNVIRPGANYGWPLVEGMGGADGGFVDPVAVWATSDASPSGLAVTAEGVYVAGLRGERLWRLPLLAAGGADADGVGEPHALLTGELGRLRAVAVLGDGDLLVLTNNTDGRGRPRAGDDRLVRLTVR
ncbi:PQQ-dependent sugar dehydrogenase [Cellulomonas gilvus]|uniref:NHL repeat containing protein n=1 Tax=Cellulomonas gilvus (strain ATCC 13127 / NRRL B-14078) TaxID=593907 RepID=F8A6N7_CELGA|nr:PQQ-dependent sugar dehydrogenase [Cellulomonas gilvus]AEI11097.1 NHL repeat containing protein [Cellulomonas gilvus ATCC 13127]